MFKKILLPLLLIVALIVTGLFYLDQRSAQLEKTAKADTAENKPFVNLEAPTENEKNSGNEIKPEIIETEKLTLPDTASVVIVDAAQYDNEVEVRAFVSNVIADGTCIYTFTKASLEIEKQTPAKADARTTPCISLVLPSSDFPEPGTWNLTVTYTNDNLTGSAQSTIEVK